MNLLAIAYTNYSTDPRVIRASESIAQSGDVVEILTLRRKGDPGTEKMNGVTVRHLPLERYRGSNQAVYILSYLYFFLLCLLYTSTRYPFIRYSAVHVHNMPEFLVFAAFIPRLFGAKIILDIHDLMPETFASKFSTGSLVYKALRLVEAASMRFAHHIITVHEPYAELIERRGVSKAKLSVVMNLPDHQIFYPRPFQRNGVFTLIYHGIVARRQGLPYVLQALARLKKENFRLKFILIGEGDGIPEVRALADELELWDMLELKPFMPVQQIPEYLVQAHLGIVPYRAEESTHYMLPVKLLEYVTMGIPVITARLNVVSYYFTDDMVYYVPPDDVEALTEAIRRLYLNPDFCERLAVNSKKFVEQYNWSKERQKIQAVYQQLLNGKAD